MIEPRNFFQARANCELYKGAGLLNLTMAESSPQNYPSKKFLQQATKTFFWGTEQWIDQVTMEGDTQKNISGTIYSQRLISQCEAINSTVNEVYANCYSKLPAFCVSDSSCAERRKEHRQLNDTIKMNSEAVEALKF